jgi:hypothetical protein
MVRMKFTTFRKVSLNLFFLCLMIVPFGMVSAQAAQANRVGFFKPYTIPLDIRTEIPVQIENVTDLFAIDFQMTFDPAILTVEDADPSATGIQIAQAKFLDPGMVLFNEVDNTQGTIRFVTSQISPSVAKSGSGNLFVIYFRGIKEGTSDLKITNLQLSTQTGVEIVANKAESAVTVAKDVRAVAATAIPVLNPSNLIAVPTAAPTLAPTGVPTLGVATQTLTPQPTRIEPAPESTPSVQVPAAFQPTAVVQSSPDGHSSSYNLTGVEWIIIIVVLLGIGLGTYFYISRKSKK